MTNLVEQTVPVLATTQWTAAPAGSRSKAERRRQWIAIALIAPLVVYLLVIFAVPLGMMISRSIYDSTVATMLPGTRAALSGWSAASGRPDDAAGATFAAELLAAAERRDVGKLSLRLNDLWPGAHDLIRRTVTALQHGPQPATAQALFSADPAWMRPELWAAIERVSSSFSGDKYLNALDIRRSELGQLGWDRDSPFVHLRVYWRTIWMSAVITAVCLLLGYPLAFYMTRLSPTATSVCMVAVLVPYWTPVLVRTTGWITLLQRQGVLNNLLVSTGLIDDDGRFSLIFNQAGTLIVMIHVLLPIMIVTLYSVMRSIPPSHLRAAMSLGASPVYAFFSVYVPLTRTGITGGVILVFMLSVGFYVTPALVGGQTGAFIGNLIALNMQITLDWGLSAALSTILLVLVLSLYFLYSGRVGHDPVAHR